MKLIKKIQTWSHCQVQGIVYSVLLGTCAIGEFNVIYSSV